MKKNHKFRVINHKSLGDKPLVSIVMPLYNSQEYLDAAIKSVLSQTYKNFELIIVDDASTDGSLKIVRKYSEKDSRIKLFRLRVNRNSGGDRCANVGISKANGKYLARMDADDIAKPERIEKQVEFLEKNPDIFMVGSNAFVIDRKGKKIGEKKEPLTSNAIYNSYFGFHPMIHPTCTFRRVLSSGKPFKYEIKYSANNDYYTFFKLICLGYKFVNLEDKLLDYRLHGKNATFIDMKEKFLNSIKIRLVMVFKFGYRPSLKDLLMLTMQTLVVMSLPERVLTEVYFLAKGIKKISFSIPTPSFSFRLG